MTKVKIIGITVLDNPSKFFNPFQFQITFECAEDLPEDLEWKVIYVGSAEDSELDQVLDTVLVGPVPAGRHMFVFQIFLACFKGIPEDILKTILADKSTCFPLKDKSWAGVIVVTKADCPDEKRLPPQDAVGVTVVLLTCSYKKAEFVRVGYYVSNEYVDPELRENPPCHPIYEQLQRNILDSEPRITKFNIGWD